MLWEAAAAMFCGEVGRVPGTSWLSSVPWRGGGTRNVLGGVLGGAGVAGGVGVGCGWVAVGSGAADGWGARDGLGQGPAEELGKPARCGQRGGGVGVVTGLGGGAL